MQYSGNSGMLRLGRIKIGKFETIIETAFLAFLNNCWSKGNSMSSQCEWHRD